MKNTLRIVSSLLIVTLFVLLNWATSPSPIEHELNADVRIYQDSLIIFENKDSMALQDARFTISVPEPTGDGYYFLNGYNLPSFSSDTLVIKDFEDMDGIPYRMDIPPTFLSLSFEIPEKKTMVNYSKEF